MNFCRLLGGFLALATSLNSSWLVGMKAFRSPGGRIWSLIQGRCTICSYTEKFCTSSSSPFRCIFSCLFLCEPPVSSRPHYTNSACVFIGEFGLGVPFVTVCLLFVSDSLTFYQVLLLPLVMLHLDVKKRCSTFFCGPARTSAASCCTGDSTWEHDEAPDEEIMVTRAGA